MRFVPHIVAVAVVASFAAVSASSAFSQTRSVRPATNVAPSASARAAQAAPNPRGLRPPFPAGVSSGSGAAASTSPIAASTAITSPSAVAATTPRSPIDPDPDANVGAGNDGIDGDPTTPNTAVLGGAPGYGVARGPGRSPAMGGSGFSAVEIARSFIHADGNRDNELTRAEAQRLSLSLMTFEEMDRNFDGILSRSEYEDGLR